MVIFENFEIALVSLGQFQNFQKCTRGIFSKLPTKTCNYQYTSTGRVKAFDKYFARKHVFYTFSIRLQANEFCGKGGSKVVVYHKIRQILSNFLVQYIIFVVGQRLLLNTVRSSCLQMFFKIGILKNFAIFTEKHPCQRSIYCYLLIFQNVDL